MNELGCSLVVMKKYICIAFEMSASEKNANVGLSFFLSFRLEKRYTAAVTLVIS